MDPANQPGRQNYIYINAAAGKHTHTLIFMHGLGDSAQGFEDVFEEGGPLYHPNLRVVLPTAPRKPVSCNNGFVMNSWFDIFKLANENDTTGINLLKNGQTAELQAAIHKEHSQKDLIESSDLQLQLVQEEAAKLNGDNSKIIIGGFSQGCMVSLTSLLRYQGAQPLCGVIGLSGILVYDKASEALSPEATQRIQQTPLFMYLGESDGFFKKAIAEFTYQPIKKIYDSADGDLKKNYFLKTEKGLAHSLSQQEILLLKQWIAKRIGA